MPMVTFLAKEVCEKTFRKSSQGAEIPIDTLTKVKVRKTSLPTLIALIKGSTGFRVGKGLALHSESRSPS